MKKVEDVKRPLKKGEIYLVPCLVKRETKNLPEEDLWLDVGNGQFKKTMFYVLPIINHPHNDAENGQFETHYHIDYRFIKHYNDANFPTIKNSHSTHVFGSKIRPTPSFGKLTYYPLPVINEDFKGITEVSLIKNSKLKHRCIHKGKCPHRGYDLSQVPVVNGIIKCPLHGLKFSSKTKQIIN